MEIKVFSKIYEFNISFSCFLSWSLLNYKEESFPHKDNQEIYSIIKLEIKSVKHRTRKAT